MTGLTIASWNINSVRLRIDLVLRFLQEYQPDVLCLQEIKSVNGQFPSSALHRLGYDFIAVNGQKGYHGVAVVSRLPFREQSVREFCGKGDSRHQSVLLPGDIELHNFYVPAGGDVPDRNANEKFAHKLDFLQEMAQWCGGWKPEGVRRILVGDLNVAPLEHDVWSHRQMLGVVSHTPIEVDHLNHVLAAHDWVDVARRFVPPEEKLYTWWSYRAADWRASNRGRRLDHIWVSPELAGMVKRFRVIDEARGWPKPSDHVPILADLEI